MKQEFIMAVGAGSKASLSLYFNGHLNYFCRLWQSFDYHTQGWCTNSNWIFHLNKHEPRSPFGSWMLLVGSLQIFCQTLPPSVNLRFFFSWTGKRETDPSVRSCSHWPQQAFKSAQKGTQRNVSSSLFPSLKVELWKLSGTHLKYYFYPNKA